MNPRLLALTCSQTMRVTSGPRRSYSVIISLYCSSVDIVFNLRTTVFKITLSEPNAMRTNSTFIGPDNLFSLIF